MERRDFLKKGCSLCLLISSGMMMNMLSSCSSLPIYKTSMHENIAEIPLTLFEENNLNIIRVQGLGYDIALHKNENNNFTALLLQCTHAENELVSTGNGFTCNLHGSRFDMEGNVTEGPAQYSLKKFPVIKKESTLIINLT